MSDQIKVVENGWRAMRVEFMAYVGIAAALGSIWWGAQLLETYGMNPGDGGVLRPFEERLMVAAITAGCGIAFAVGLLVYQSLFVVGISRAGDAFYVHSKVACFNMIKRLNLNDVSGSSYVHKSAEFYTFEQRATPRQQYLTMRIKGWWLPYIIDPQARHIDRAQLFKIIPKAVSSWNSDCPPSATMRQLDANLRGGF